MYLTVDQVKSLYNKWEQNNQDLGFVEFLKKAEPTVGMDNAVVVPWSGMWLAVETDGYTHS
jgi:hypothetical protein